MNVFSIPRQKILQVRLKNKFKQSDVNKNIGIGTPKEFGPGGQYKKCC